MTTLTPYDEDVGPLTIDETILVKRAAMANDITLDVSDMDEVTLRVDTSGTLSIKQ